MGAGASAPEFAAAIGICAGVTALPILAAILKQLSLVRQPLGQLALACAAFNDALLWIGLALLLAAHAGSGGGSAWPALLGGPLYAFLVLGVARPVAGRLLERRQDGEAVGEAGLALACAVALASPRSPRRSASTTSWAPSWPASPSRNRSAARSSPGWKPRWSSR